MRRGPRVREHEIHHPPAKGDPRQDRAREEVLAGAFDVEPEPAPAPTEMERRQAQWDSKDTRTESAHLLQLDGCDARCKRCGVGGKDLGLRWTKSKGGKFYLQGCYRVVVRDGENASEEQSWLPHFKFCAANPSRIVEAT